MLRNHLLFWKQSHTLPLQRLSGQGSRLPIVSGTLSDIRSIPATRSQGSRAPRHGLEPSQTRHWYYTAPPFYVLEIFFFFFLISSNPGHFLFYFCLSVSAFNIFFFNLAVVGKSSPWSTPTSIAEASPSSLRSWPAWRKWKAVVLQAPWLRVECPPSASADLSPGPLRGLLRCRLLLGAMLGHHSRGKPALLRRVAVFWCLPNGAPLWANRDSWPLCHLLISLGR